jgi:hypothetical protein
LLGLAFVFGERRKRDTEWARPLYPALLALTISATAGGIWHDYLLTKSWARSYAVVKDLRRHNPGCNLMDQEGFTFVASHISLAGFSSFWLPALSLGIEESNRVESIFFLEDERGFAACRPQEGFFYLRHPEEDPRIPARLRRNLRLSIPLGRLDLTAVTEGKTYRHVFDQKFLSLRREPANP